jgi:hypothetical protein
LLNASAEVQIEAVTVGAHGEFDDEGLAGGGVSVGAKAGIGTDKDGNIVAGGGKLGAGPLEIGVNVHGTVSIEIDRTGITDIKIEAGAGSSVGSNTGIPKESVESRIGVRDKSDEPSATTKVTADVKAGWSWNGGASASASGNFDRSVF